MAPGPRPEDSFPSSAGRLGRLIKVVDVVAQVDQISWKRVPQSVLWDSTAGRDDRDDEVFKGCIR